MLFSQNLFTPSPLLTSRGVRPGPVPVYDLFTPADLIDADRHWAYAPADPVPVVAWDPDDGVFILGDLEAADDAVLDVEDPAVWPARRLPPADRVLLHLRSPLGRRDIAQAMLLGALLVLACLKQ